MPFTTGYISNSAPSGSAAANVVINLVNVNTTNAATVEIRIFYSLSNDIKTPLYVTLVTLPVNSVRRRTFFIQGVTSYEIQYNVTSLVPGDVVLSSFALDPSGNIVQEQRVLQKELTPIFALSPTS